MFLANLLPGLRELRAPLAAGYTLLLAAFLFAGGRFAAETQSHGVMRSLFDVSDALGKTGAIAALTFVAYLVGALIADLAVAGFNRFGLSIGPLGRQMLHDHALEACQEADGTDQDALPRPGAAVAARKVLSRVEQPRDEDLRARAWYVRTPSLYREDELDVDEPELSARRLANQTFRELDLVQTRLLGPEPDLYGAVDRLRSEVELRQAITVSGLVLALAVGIDVHWAAGLGVAVFAALLPPQAGRRQREANNLLAQALWLGRVEAPTMERFRKTAGIERQVRETEPEG